METALKTTFDSDGVATVWMDLPGKPVNTCSPRLLDELAEELDKLQKPPPHAVIFTSAKPRSFNAGADLFELRKMNDAAKREYLAKGQAIFARIAALPIPTIAAINGDALGGGFELALACRFRVASDSTSISIGLPETKLGLIPAWGGTTRLVNLIGLRNALPILLAGKTLPPRKAQKAGLVDEVVRPESLQQAAKRIALAGVIRKPRRLDHLPLIRRRILAAARRQTMAQTRGNYPAPLAILDVVHIGCDQGMDAGLAAEQTAIVKLIGTDPTRNLLRLFFLRQNAKKEAAAHVSASPHEIFHAAVIGGGTMGAGIAHALIRAAIPVRLVEVDPPAVSAALGRVKQMLDDDVKAGRLDRLAAHHAFNRLSPTTDWTGLELADIVIEAVLETIAAKRDVFSKLDRLVRPTAVLATNTSSLRIADIAQATLHPERIVGLHFFNPVPKMPLVEVVRGPQSDEPSLATAVALAVRLGKTPIVVADAPGFVVNRVLVPYLAEALATAADGVPIDRIDAIMKDFGMPMGPFELLDEIGLDVAGHVLQALAPGRTAPTIAAALATSHEHHWLGKKTGKGFYIHGGRKHKLVVNEELAHVLALSTAQPEPSAADIQKRLIAPMVHQAVQLLRDGIIHSADSLDLAMVLGTGFAPFRGGVMQYGLSSNLIAPAPSAELAGKAGQHAHV